MLALFKGGLNEASDGFWTAATNLYPYLAAGQNEAITILLGIEDTRKKTDGKHYRHPELAPLVTLDTLNTTTTGSSEVEYNLPSDFLATYRARYSNLNTGNIYEATLFPYEEIKRTEIDFYGKASTTKPKYYIRASKIGFFPQPSGGRANGYEHHYYKDPSDIASGVEATLKPRTHTAIVEYALYKAWTQDGQPERAQMHYKNFINILTTL